MGPARERLLDSADPGLYSVDTTTDGPAGALPLEAERLAAADVEVDALDCLEVAEGLAQPARQDHRVSHEQRG